MPAARAADHQDSHMLVASAPAAAAPQSLGGASGGPQPHQGRFHVSHVSLVCQRHDEAAGIADSHGYRRDESQKAPAIDSQCEQLHMAVGILDSLPWGRGAGLPAATVAVPASACLTIPELAEDGGEAAGTPAAGANSDGLGDAADGCTLTAQVGKSMSQLRMSASSSNFPSMDCRCCCEDTQDPPAAPCDCGGPLWEPPQPQAAHREAGGGVDSGEGAASHLEPPWSHNSCCRSGSRPRPESPASLTQLAASHRSERVGASTLARSASFRRRPSSAAQHPSQPHNSHLHHETTPECVGGEGCALPESEDRRQLTYQEYLEQLHERVQLWLLGADDSGADQLLTTDEAAAEAAGGGSDGSCCYGGSPDRDDYGTVTAATAAAYCHSNYCHSNWVATAAEGGQKWLTDD